MFSTHQQEAFSRAFVAEVASAAGVKVQAGATPDDDSIDLTLGTAGGGGRIRSPKLDVQVKCTGAPVPAGDLRFPLKLKNYDDLRPPREAFQSPRILVVVLVPTDADRWIEHAHDETILRHAAFWTSLHGAPAVDNQNSVTVTLPAANRFTTDTLKSMFRRLGEGEGP